MKGSDSTNSLTELTHPEKCCFICLDTETNEKGEPLVDSKLLRTCGCKFSVHPVCWNEWLKDKSDYDCPICRKDSMLRIRVAPNPVMTVIFEDERRQQRHYWKVCGCFLVSATAAFLVSAIIFWGH